MSSLRSLAVAVPSWNGRHHLATCLAALARQRGVPLPWEVWVLDNGSTDGTAEWLRGEHPAVRLVESPRNLGFAAGVNRLVEACGADGVALLNNDTRPQESWLAALADALAAAPADVAAVSGRIVDWQGERLDFGRGVVTFDGHAFQLDFRRPLGEARLPRAGDELAFACGGNMLVRREAFRAAGGFDADYFAYYEDVDLGWRLWARGLRVLAAPEAVVRHHSSATSDLLGLYHRGMLFERNAFLTAYKNYDDELWPRLLPAVLLTLTSRTQALLVGHNPGGEQLAVDPYDGGIAATGGPGGAAAEESAGIWAKIRRHGLPGATGRAVRKLGRMLAGIDRAGWWGEPRITDPRTVAQLRAVSYLLRHLDRAAEKRARNQAARRVPDREILARFPLYLVPTYPGDEALFASPGFRRWLPEDVPLVEATLGELMDLG
ncbi:MAG TPA: glycosyltransferase family 2 protein [Thermoanaerobaculia bacterium]|nr:glycosyltransferase family 2 protein [Thermoanaerobaculia bacterium]